MIMMVHWGWLVVAFVAGGLCVWGFMVDQGEVGV